MHKQYFLSDPHFRHINILKFTDNNGELIRGNVFSSIEEHDETIIENINKKVRIQDKLYLMGDIGFKRSSLTILEKINTKKLILLKGNHDLEKLSVYCQYFKDIRAYKIFSKHGIIFSHIPVHPKQLEGRFNLNCHGHLHQNIIDDKRYLNLCCEHTSYEPVELEEILAYKRSNNL